MTELVGPSRWLQRMAIRLLARVGRAHVLRASYAHHHEVYARRQQARTPEIALMPEEGLEPPTRGL